MDTGTSALGSIVAETPPTKTKVRLSPWVNEKLPSLEQLLSAHDVARLTRRPKWLLSGLMLLGRFPKKQRFRGRQIGWSRADIIDWLCRDLATEEPAHRVDSTPRRCAKAVPLQPCLPLECTVPCTQKRLRPGCSSRSDGSKMQRVAGGKLTP
jgi:predicted DNA-binding transcriptional regulator AlpA